MLEETYETLAAIDAGDQDALEEELGDLLLMVLMLAQIGADSGEFTINSILERINAKIVRHHPHVFGPWDSSSLTDDFHFMAGTAASAAATPAPAATKRSVDEWKRELQGKPIEVARTN